MTGYAPCKCGRFERAVELTGYSEPDGMGGKNWQCGEGQSCPECAEPFNWLHQPAAESLVVDTTLFKSQDETPPDYFKGDWAGNVYLGTD